MPAPSQIVLATDAFIKELESANAALAMGPEICILLGCPYKRDGEYFFDDEPAPMSPAERADAAAGLFRILHMVVPTFGLHSDNLPFLLTGIRRQRLHPWADGTIDQTYDLAVAILTYVDAYWENSLPDVATAVPVCNMLNNWLKPTTPWDELPSDAEIADYMFGPVWLMTADTENFVLAEVVQRERPCFVNGLCRAQVLPLGLDLPGLELPSIEGTP